MQWCLWGEMTLIAFMRLRRAASPYSALRPDGQQQCVLFAFCCSKDESGRTPVRPLGASKSRDALNEPHVPFDFFFGPFFFFAITLLLRFLMNLIRQGLSSRRRRQTTAKQWCIINERRMNRPTRVVSVASHPKVDQRRRARDGGAPQLPPIRSRRLPRAAFRFGGGDTDTTLEGVRPCA